MLIGFVLFVSACGYDACEALPVTEHVYPTFASCRQIAERLHARRPQAVLLCGEVYR